MATAFMAHAGVLESHSSAGLVNFNLGIIGLDTSHSPAFTRLIHAADRGARVTHAYPYGSRSIASSAERIPQYTDEIMGLGVKVLDDLDELIGVVDGILLETNDGTAHLEQARRVFRTGKPVFIDKPVAARLPDVIRIYREAAEAGVPVFSSSGLRYLEGAQRARSGELGTVQSADTYSPVYFEPSHSDLFWYGIHGVETLITVMGTGCREVQRIKGPFTDLVIGRWEDGRLGCFRGDLLGRQHYGGTANGEKGSIALGAFAGYGALVDNILDFFLEGSMPVDPEETLEVYTFMAAAEESSFSGGAWISLAEVYRFAAG